MSAFGVALAVGLVSVTSGDSSALATSLTIHELGVRSNEPIVLGAGDLVVRLAVEDATGEPWLVEGGYFVGRSAAGDTLLVQPFRDRLEDFRVVTSPRPGALARYRLELDPGAHLRTVAGVIEIVDERGTPRMRMARPFVIDAAGARLDVRTTIEGCAVDRDPSPPWGRSPRPPGAPSCTIVIDLADGPLPAYPILLDPLWIGTSALVEARVTQAVPLGSTGRVLLPGGRNDAGYVASAEVYDEATNSFAAVAALPQPRAGFGLAWVEASGVALLAGGCAGTPSACSPTASSLAFEPTTGTWRDVGALAEPRVAHRAYPIASGRVLVVGGVPVATAGVEAFATTEIFEPATELFAAGPALRSGRHFFGGTTISDGGVMIVGGRTEVGGEDLPLVDRFDATTGTWLPMPDLPSERRDSFVAQLPDGRVAVAGGTVVVTPLRSSLVLEPQSGWTSTGPLSTDRDGSAAALLDNGWLVVATGNGTDTAEAMRVDEAAVDATWLPIEPLGSSRMRAAQAKLPSGDWLVAGGWGSYENDALDTAFVLHLASSGAVCESGATCRSGYCVDGVCCESACEGACVACSIAAGASADGACTPLAEGTVDPSGACPTEGGCGATGACGSDGACALAAAGSSCSCDAESTAGSCDGAGTCTCIGSRCVDGETQVDESGRVAACAPYRCAGAGCIETCASSSDCVPGAVCDRSRRCVSAGDVPLPVTACTCNESPALPGRASPAALLALALVLGVRRLIRTSARA